LQNGDFVQRHAEAVSLHCRVGVLYVLAEEGTKRYEVESSRHKNLFEVRVYFPKSSRFSVFSRYQNYLKAHRLGYEAILKEMGRIDLVHLNVIYKAGIFALELKKKYNIPYILTEHWTAFLPINPVWFTPYQKYVIKKIGRGASLLCPVSHDLKKAMQQFGLPGPYEVVPNVVDTKLFGVRERSVSQDIAAGESSPSGGGGNRKKKTGDASIKKMLHISTLYDVHKNVSGLLRVVKKLSALRSDFSLTIVGNGYIAEHQQTICQLELEKVVNLKGEIPHTEVAREMQAHDLFVLFSNFENLPCVIIEAQASGLPVLATDVGGISEMIDEASGRLVPARDEEALLEKMNGMLDEMDNYERLKIRESAVTRFSYEEVGERFKHIYQRIVKKEQTK
jgi:glycosyltransferase involved in cell wall biosynthesis